VNDLARQVRQSFYGDEVQRIQRGRNEVKVMLRLPREDRKSLATLDYHARAHCLTDSRCRSPRRRGQRGEDPSPASSAWTAAGPSTSPPTWIRSHGHDDPPRRSSPPSSNLLAGHSHIRWSFEGEARVQKESVWSMLVSVGLVLAAMYALMAIPFRSYTQPFIVLLVIPFGVVGAVIGHLFHGLPLSIMSSFGMLAVCGVVVNDTLVLVDEINHLKDEGVPIREAVQRGGLLRFRAIFLTQITTFFGLVPLIFDGTWLARLAPFFFSNGAQATHAQFLTPVSVAMGYGSLFATIITLFLVPLCYIAVEDVKGWFLARPKVQELPAVPAEAS
jgi:multidrug efflux pump subunit AcrB